MDEEGSIFDGRSARCLARCVNRGYVTGCHSATFQWHLISSFYDFLPWSRCGVAVANEPWSGHYEITAPLWVLAHTTQFAKPGWRYTAHGSGVDMLGLGGSVVTRVSPDGADFSVVIEKMTTEHSACARGSNPSVTIATEPVQLVLKGGLLAAAKSKGLHLWRSNLTSGDAEGVNPPDSALFQLITAPSIGADGSVTINVCAEEIYTLTTLATGHKGVAAKRPPASAPFPLPFTQNFDDEASSAPPAIWYDQMGAWQVQPKASADGTTHVDATDMVMRQVSPVWPACWGYSCSGPLTYFGPQKFNCSSGFKMTLNVMIEAAEDATFSLSAKGMGVQIDSATGAWNFTGTGHSTQGGSSSFRKGQWHTLYVGINTTHIVAALDGNMLGTGANKGKEGFYVQMGLDKYVYADVDNWSVAEGDLMDF